MEEELFYRVALTMIPELGPVRVRLLIESIGSAKAVFTMRKKELSQVSGISISLAQKIKQWNGFREAEAEADFIAANKIDALFLTDEHYPKRLLHCYDPPPLLYYRGNADLNQSKIVSIIGTRNHTPYGKQVTEELIDELRSQHLLVVSGLAFGIDAAAHRAALQANIATVGVLAHGLDTIYPSQHRSLAKEMMMNGGLLTEFRTGTQPDKHNFPKRNRIVAGMSDATIVIETDKKGGSMITAEMAHQYNRDLFAVPGRITDSKSHGCLQLINQNKAILFTGAADLVQTMGWADKKNIPHQQRVLFINLSETEQLIVDIIAANGTMAVDELYLRSGLSSSTMAAAILNLELQQVIRSLPGKLFTLC